tara:strand:- start:17303 stop:18682 length:1380 start_codon:yes stop_codon:yes gene_type:complete
MIKKTQPLVTIYIPSRNYGRYLEQSIQSIIDQIYINWELFIIDEGSNDNTEKVSKKFQDKYPSKIIFIKNKTPKGLQKVANEVLKKANGKYMIRLDADDWLNEIALFIMVEKLENNSKAGIAYGNYFYTDISGTIIGVETRPKLGDEDMLGQIPPHGACTMFETESLRKAGGYSERVDAQDGWDLWYKLYKKIGAISIDIPLFYYRQHDNSLSKDNSRLLKARAKIFHEIREKTIKTNNLKIVALIPVKESYPSLKNVPYKKIRGKTLLEIAINNALKSKEIDEVILYSQSQKVLDFSKKLETNNKVPKHLRLLRTQNKESNNIPIRDFMFSAGEHYTKQKGVNPDIVMFLSLHAVNRRKIHIEKAINNLLLSGSDSVVSVQEEREPMFNYGKSGLNLINPGRFRNLSFDKEKLYRFNGSIIATNWETIKSGSLFGLNTSFIEMSSKDSIQIKNINFLI